MGKICFAMHVDGVLFRNVKLWIEREVELWLEREIIDEVKKIGIQQVIM